MEFARSGMEVSSSLAKSRGLDYVAGLRGPRVPDARRESPQERPDSGGQMFPRAVSRVRSTPVGCLGLAQLAAR